MASGSGRSVWEIFLSWCPQRLSQQGYVGKQRGNEHQIQQQGRVYSNWGFQGPSGASAHIGRPRRAAGTPRGEGCPRALWLQQDHGESYPRPFRPQTWWQRDAAGDQILTHQPVHWGADAPLPLADQCFPPEFFFWGGLPLDPGRSGIWILTPSPSSYLPELAHHRSTPMRAQEHI